MSENQRTCLKDVLCAYYSLLEVLNSFANHIPSICYEDNRKLRGRSAKLIHTLCKIMFPDYTDEISNIPKEQILGKLSNIIIINVDKGNVRFKCKPNIDRNLCNRYRKIINRLLWSHHNSKAKNRIGYLITTAYLIKKSANNMSIKTVRRYLKQMIYEFEGRVDEIPIEDFGSLKTIILNYRVIKSLFDAAVVLCKKSA